MDGPYSLTSGFRLDIFAEISRAVEDVASDYHEEYAFKKYLQEKWDQLIEKL